jgi:hypothetical protein
MGVTVQGVPDVGDGDDEADDDDDEDDEAPGPSKARCHKRNCVADCPPFSALPLQCHFCVLLLVGTPRGSPHIRTPAAAIGRGWNNIATAAEAFFVQVAKKAGKGLEDAQRHAQFIVTTFHPQIVAVADQAYGVENKQRISTVKSISRAMALEFVRNDTSHRARASGCASAGGSMRSGPSKVAAAAAKRPSKRLKENRMSEDNDAAAA